MKRALLDLFGRSVATSWQDACSLWSEGQRANESVDDFIARVTKIAKRLPNIDASTLRYAIITGFPQDIRAQVLQSKVQNISELIEAARLAAMAHTGADTTMTTVLEELRHNNQQHTDAVQQLTTRLDRLKLGPVDPRQRDN